VLTDVRLRQRLNELWCFRYEACKGCTSTWKVLAFMQVFCALLLLLTL